MASAEPNNNHLQLVARIEDYRGFVAEAPRVLSAADYQKIMAELALVASTLLAITEMLSRIGPPSV